MLNKEVFLKDPTSWRLLNEGVSSNNSVDEETLRYELETFVCEGEYHHGLAKMLQGYLDNLDKEQKAAWVSGFYGSGKSHLVKVLRYLWSDYEFQDKAAARSITHLPREVSDLLRELSTHAKRGAGLHSAGGTLKAGVGSVRLRLLNIIFQSADLPENVSVARLMMDLREENKFDSLCEHIVKSGKDPDVELKKIYTSKALHEAYLKCHPHLDDIRNVSAALREQYPAKVEDVSIQEMVDTMRRVLSRDGKIPCTVIILDEIQQYINNNADVALEVQEVVEACSKKMNGRVLLVGTGQSALTDTPALQRLMGRFAIKVHLKDNDVEKVVRTVVLQKNESRKKDLDDLVEHCSGEITRQLKATRIATCSDDDHAYVPDYPLLPVRLRFWEHVLHSIDPTGTTAQMRTQLRVTHEACRAVADQKLGTIVPADFLYDQLANDLVISGEMQKRFQEIIEEQKTKQDGELRSRICSLVFLINKLPREGADIGVRANNEHLADLLTGDLSHSATAFREKIPHVTKLLLADGVLMEVEGEYRLQTTEGAAWEGEYRRRRSSVLNDDPKISAARGQLLYTRVNDELARVSILQGSPREKRRVSVHHGMERPASSDGITVWVRDGFQESESAVIQDIQKLGVDDATIHVLIPKTKADEIKNAVASALAAEETINFKGTPTADEGKEARKSMLSRQANEEAKYVGLIADVIGRARVFLSGGQEMPVISLKETIEDAGKQVLARLYPNFDVADSANWPSVLKKAKEGNAAALTAVGYQGDPDKHPVAAELMRFIGAGKKGSEVIEKFTAPPYGWPKDAIDAVLAILVLSGHLGARLKGQAIGLGDLDQRRLSQADFRVEKPVLTAVQKIRIKQLFQEIGYRFNPGDEAGSAPGFVQSLKALSRSAGGDAPVPEAPSAPELIELEGKAGNDLLFSLFEKADDLSQKIAAWKSLAAEIERRRPQFELTSQLLGFASALEGMTAQNEMIEAVCKNRSLLSDPDPVSPILRAVGTSLRAALKKAHGHFKSIYNDEMEKLEQNPTWKRLDKKKRDSFIAQAAISTRVEPAVGTDEELLCSLQQCDLSGWRTLADALPTRFAQALSLAIKEAEPKAKPIRLPSATIHSREEADAWLNEVRALIEGAMKDGPVIL